MTFLIAAALLAGAGAPADSTLDLSGWVAVALGSSPAMDISEADMMSAEAGLRSSRSFLWPSLHLSSSAGHSWYDTPATTGGWEATDASSYSLSLSLSQELLASGGASWLGMSASEHAVAAAGHEMEQTELELILDVVEAYYGVIESERLLAAAGAALERSASQAERTASLYGMGAATNLEMIQAEVQVSNDSLSFLQREQSLSSAYAELRRVAGVTGSSMRVDTAAVLGPVERETALGYRVDLDSSNDILAARERVREAELALEAQRRSYWPSLSASAGWSWTDDEPDLEQLDHHDRLSVSVSLSYPVFDGFMRESGITAQRASLLRRQATLESLENTLRTSVRNARETLLISISALEVAQLAEEQAREQLRLSEMSYELGSISLLDLLSAQSTLASSQASVVSARMDCLIAEARLLVLLGRTPRLGE